MLLMLDGCLTFIHSHSRAVAKINVINSNVYRSEHNYSDVRITKVFALEQTFFKPMNPVCFCAPL